MRRRLFAPLGFMVGLGTASLFNPDFSSAIARQAIASIDASFGQASTAQPALAQSFTASKGCLNNSESASLRSIHPQNISLLKHVPSLPQRLNWYGITQERAIANAPKPIAPKPAITQWTRVPRSRLGSSEQCSSQQSTIASQTSVGIAKRSFSPLKQQSHFILSIASLNQKNDWLLQPQLQASQPVHSMWHGLDPMEL